MKCRNFLVLAGVIVAAVGCSSPEPTEVAGSSRETSAVETTKPVHDSSIPAASETRPTIPNPIESSSAPVEEHFPFPVVDIGKRFQHATSGLTVQKVSVQDRVPVKAGEGPALRAAKGEKLVLVETKYENLGHRAVDLSCAGPLDLYVTAFDSANNEMPPVFETYKIAGNPECNYQLMAGKSSPWKILFRMRAGSSPAYLQIQDADNFDSTIVAKLTKSPLEFSITR